MAAPELQPIEGLPRVLEFRPLAGQDQGPAQRRAEQ